jgi:hypothetical protein
MMKHWWICAAVMLAPAVGAAHPASPAEALRDLRHNAAAASSWAHFGEGSYVRMLIHDSGTETGESKTTRIQELKSKTEKGVRIAVWDGEHQEELAALTYPLDDSDLDAARAVKLGDDSIPIGNQVYAAQIYQFTDSYDVLNEKRTRRYQYWLAAGVPGGELRRAVISQSNDPGYGGTEATRLVALKVPCAVGKKTLECYCRDLESKSNDGTVELLHACYHDSVPGRLVSKSARKLRDGKEVLRQEVSLIEFRAVKP